MLSLDAISVRSSFVRQSQPKGCPERGTRGNRQMRKTNKLKALLWLLTFVLKAFPLDGQGPYCLSTAPLMCFGQVLPADHCQRSLYHHTSILLSQTFLKHECIS